MEPIRAGPARELERGQGRAIGPATTTIRVVTLASAHDIVVGVGAVPRRGRRAAAAADLEAAQ
jgi:hypothetical protein